MYMYNNMEVELLRVFSSQHQLLSFTRICCTSNNAIHECVSVQVQGLSVRTFIA